MKNLEFKKLYKYVLKMLKDFKEINPNAYISLPDILEILNYKASFNEALEIAKYMETRGWLNSLFVIGDVRLQITSAGLVEIDEYEEGFDEEYKNYLSDLTKEKGQLKLTTYTEPKDSKLHVVEFLNDISSKIKETEGHEIDLNKDIEIIKIELSKSQPNIEALEEKFRYLMNLQYVASDVQLAKKYIFQDEL